MLTLEQLAIEVEAGAIDTVVSAFTDMQGRLLGKREEAHYFLEQTVAHGLGGLVTHASCNGVGSKHSSYTMTRPRDKRERPRQWPRTTGLPMAGGPRRQTRSTSRSHRRG